MTDKIYQVIFRIAEVLEIPVIILSLLALGVVILEIGAFATEQWRRRRRSFDTLSEAAASARRHLDQNDRAATAADLDKVAWSAAMSGVLEKFAASAGAPGAEPLMAKLLADFDFVLQRRLGRTRLLVRVGPALGLMGTLIPLAPALEGLANGDVETLSLNLRVAFSITVLGLLIGALAFGLSLARERIYGHDYSDLEYVAAVLTAPATDIPDESAATGSRPEESVP